MNLFRLLLLCFAIASASVSAQTFPAKPIRLVIPFAAGSATDTVARPLAQFITERTKATIVVDNRPGAQGVIASELVKQAPPDGYTILLATTTTHSQLPFLMKKMPYDPLRDFTPIAGIGGFPYLIVLHPSVPVRNIREFANFIKSRPGEMTYGWPNAGAQICAEALARRTQTKLVGVPYKSSPQSLLELIDGQIGMICSDFASSHTHVRANRLRAIAVTTHQRLPELPGIPTIKETYADFPEIRSWIGALAPPGTPREVVEWLEREILAATANPAFAARLAPLGFARIPLGRVAVFGVHAGGAEEVGRDEQGRRNRAAVSAKRCHSGERQNPC